MARIKRKPVSSAFYADEFPTVFSLGPALPPSPKNSETFTSKGTSLRGNAPSDPPSRLDGSTLIESQTGLLNGHRHIQPNHPGIVASVLQSKAKENHIENVCELPGDSYYLDGIYDGKHRSVSTRKLWTPFWLRKSILSGFIVTYILLLVCVAALWRVSRDQNGFTPSISTNRYTWTYGPTALLVIVVSLWRQLDYHCKVLAPWQEMKRGAEASRSLLLDYVSPFQLDTFRLAVRHGTIPVIATIIGFACLKLVIIFSTGLLVLSPIKVTDSTYPIEITAAFDRSGFNPSLAAGGLDYSTDSNGPLYAYYGHLANNLTLPIGAKGSLAYTTFGSRGELPSKATLSSKVEVMVPQFDCEAAKVTPLSVDYSGWRGAGNSALATFESSSCTIEYVNLRARDPRKSICPPKQLSAVLSLVDCGARRETSGTVAAPWDGVSPDIRFIVAVTDFRYTQTPAYSVIRNETVFNATDFSSSVEGVSGVICKSAYSMLEADLTYDTSEQDESHRFSVSAPHVLSGRLLENFSTDNLSRAVDTAFATSYTMVDRQPSAELDPQSPDLMSKLMLLVAEESSLQIFLDDAETMKSAAAKTLNGVAAQYAQQSLLMPTSEPSTGKLVFVEDRLKVQTTSTILILTCLVLLVLMTAVVLVSRPYDVVPRKSDSLGALSVILSANQNLQSVLADLGRSSNSGLRQCLSGYRFSSHIVWRTEKEATFHIASSTTDPTVGIPGPSSEIHNWHRPLPIRKGFIATILILPLIVIGILEGLQQASDRHNGFLTLPEDASEHNSTTTVLIHYIPALFMLLVATLFNMLDFTVSTFAPFSALRIGNSPAKRSVFSCLLSELPPIALYRAAIEHHWGALCSNLAGFTGSVLTIIVSGLLVVEKINMATNISVQQLDSFTIDAYNATSSNTTTTLTLIEQFNLSFPIFTYEDLAFPRIKLSHDIPVLEQAANEGSDLSLSVDLPALRPSLDCRTLLEDEITLIFNQSNDEHVDRGPEIVLQAAINLPDGCGGATVNYDFPFPVFDGEKPVTDAPNSDNGWSFAGAIGDLSDVRIDSSECPSLVFFFGSFKMNVISYENVTVMSCSQHMQDVHAFTTFNMSNLNIDPSRPPVVNESTIKLLPNNTSGHTSLWYPVARKFEDNIASFSGSNAYGQLDHFFQTLTLGSDGVPPTELVGPANAPTLLNRVTHLYRKYMVQVINADMRTAPLYPNPTYNATVAQPTARLKQNKGSKITLQILLSVMLACSALAYYLTPHPRHTLPHNPHTLAGSMSLLAGSEMCSRAVVPEGAEWMSDKELKKAGVFEGYLFSLGWWAGDGRRRFGVDMGRAEKA